MEVNQELLHRITNRASVIDPRFVPLSADTEVGNTQVL